MTDIIEDLAAYIETSLGLATNSVGRDFMSENASSALKQFPGIPPSKISTSVSWNIQILTRGDREAARSLNWRIYKLLVSFADKTNYTFLLDGRFIRASAINQPVKIERDSKSRIIYASNILLFTSEEV